MTIIYTEKNADVHCQQNSIDQSLMVGSLKIAIGSRRETERERGEGRVGIVSPSARLGNDVGHYGNKIKRLLLSANSPTGRCKNVRMVLVRVWPAGGLCWRLGILSEQSYLRSCCKLQDVFADLWICYDLNGYSTWHSNWAIPGILKLPWRHESQI